VLTAQYGTSVAPKRARDGADSRPEGALGAGTGRTARVRLVGALAVGVCGAFLTVSLWRSWGDVRSSLGDARPGTVALALVAAVVAMVLIGLVWTDVLRAVGAPVARRRVVAWYFAGETGKYVPGGVWSVLGRGELAARGGVARATAYQSVAVSLLLLYGAAAAVAAVLSLVERAGVLDYAWALVAVPVAIAALHPRATTAALAVARRVTGRPVELAPLAPRTSIALAARYVPAWITVAGATVLAAQALRADAGIVDTAHAAILAWLAGFAFVPAPGGIGVREACFVALSDLPAGEATAVALLARLCFVATDAIGAAASVWWLRRAPAPRPVGAPGVDA